MLKNEEICEGFIDAAVEKSKAKKKRTGLTRACSILDYRRTKSYVSIFYVCLGSLNGLRSI